MNRVTTLLRTEHVMLHRFDHPAGCFHQDPAEERVGEWGVNFVERGSFSLHTKGRRDHLRAGSVFVSRPDLTYRCRHHEACPDDVCLSLELGPVLMEEGAHHFARAGLPPVLHGVPRAAYWYGRLQHALNEGPMTAEAVGVEAVASLSGMAASHRPGALSREVGRVEAARDHLYAEFRRPLFLSEVARVAGVSPFEFARRFRALVGLPPHRYLIRLRLMDAISRLEQGDSVTRAAIDSGFENLSHFTRTFRRWLTVPPSAWRALSGPDRSRKKVQAILAFAR